MAEYHAAGAIMGTNYAIVVRMLPPMLAFVPSLTLTIYIEFTCAS